MNKLRIAQAALATILAVGIQSTTQAFMAAPAEQATKAPMSLTELVDSLREEIAAKETSCEDMLVKLDEALEDIDAKLDAGVPNEDEYLKARDEIAKMRYDLECLANKLTQGGTDMPIPMDQPPTFNSGNPSSGGSFGGGGVLSGGGGAGGGSGLGVLGLMGVAGGTIAGVSNDDSNPGFVASFSGSN
jgi:hypothetical protein